MGGYHGYNPDSPKDLRAPSQEARPHVPEPWVSNDGWALVWIDAILLVPAIFGVMFLPTVVRLLVLSAGIAVVAAFGILYSRARVHPASTSAHVLDLLHIGPRRRVAR